MYNIYSKPILSLSLSEPICINIVAEGTETDQIRTTNIHWPAAAEA